MSSLKDRIMEVLESRELLTKEQLDKAVTIQHTEGGSLQKILVDQGFLNEADLLAAISQGLGIPPISLARLKFDSSLASLLDRNMAKLYEVVPVSKMGQTLTVAMADPLNIFALDTIATKTGLNINPLLTTHQDIMDAIERYYGSGVEASLQEVIDKAESGALEFFQEPEESGASDAESLLRQTQETPVIKFTELLVAQAVRIKSSDILIEPREKSVRVRYRVDGMLQEGQSPPKSMHNAVVSRIKVMSDLDIAERRVPQDGHFMFNTDGRYVDLRVSILPSCFGETVCMRVQDKSNQSLNIETLGFSEFDVERLKAAALKPHGMILTTGPTGTGKTTTLYSMLKLIDQPERNLVTVEDPVEFDLGGINQVNVKPDVGMTFSAALRSILRQDPDVIMVGEIRDAETADMAIKSALTGHLVLSTLHTNSATGTITRLVNMGVEPFLMNSSLIVIAAQRLVRKICLKCAETYIPAKDLADRLGLLDKQGNPVELKKPVGCKSCYQSGYLGREVIAEVLMMSPEIREQVLKGEPEKLIEQTARRQGMKTLREQGLVKAMNHITSLEEVFRTTLGDVVETD